MYKKQIVLDIETTGLDIKNNNRIIEIGCIELINRKFTGNNLHFYINPLRNSEEEALKIHGIKNVFLKNKPQFFEIIDKFCNYIYNSEIIIHNADFDINFLNHEFKILNLLNFNKYVLNIIDTLIISKLKFPGKRNSLNALCDRYKISRLDRKYHSAILDANLLANVYLILTSHQYKINYQNYNNINYYYKLINKEKIKIIYATKKDIKNHKKFKKKNNFNENFSSNKACYRL